MTEQAKERALRPIYSALDSFNYSKALKLTYAKPLCDWPITIALRAHCFERTSRKLDACREIRILATSLSTLKGENDNASRVDDDWCELDEMIWLLGLGSEGERSSVGMTDVGVSLTNSASSSKGKNKKGKSKTSGTSLNDKTVDISNTYVSSTVDIVNVLDLPRHKLQSEVSSSKCIINSFTSTKNVFDPNDIVDEVSPCNETKFMSHTYWIFKINIFHNYCLVDGSCNNSSNTKITKIASNISPYLYKMHCNFIP